MPTPIPQDPALAATEAAIRRMTSFAVMTVDWSGQRRSYLDNFLNYVLFVVPSNSPTAFPREAIRPLIIQRFNLTLPANIVQQLVRRAVKLNLLSAIGDDAVVLTEKGKREVAPIPYTLRKLDQQQADVAEGFREWAERELSFAMDQSTATSMLLDYVETYYCSLMHLSDGDARSALRFPKVEPTAEQRMVAAFIASVPDTDSALFESIANLARGSMMVSALFAPSLVDTTRGFRRTTMYLDTKIVLRALGYEGEPAEQSTLELLQLLRRQGARVAIFEFTLREIQSVLDAVAQKSRAGRVWDSRPGSVESYFYRHNASNAQIEQHSVRVESRIIGLDIHVDPSPAYDNHRFVVDEASIEASLLATNPNYRPTAIKHDVELIASVVRARAGLARSTLEESRATFVTLNSVVINTARGVQRDASEPWPLAMFETDVAALTWIKEPLAAPNLPRNQLLATSLGLTNPGKHDWALYISEIGRLLEAGSITDNDLILLRQKYEMDRLAFVRPPMADGSSRKQEVRASIEEARRAVAHELTAPVRAERDAVERRLEGELAQSRIEASAADQDRDQLTKQLLTPIWRSGSALKWIVTMGLVLVCGVALLLTFIPGADRSISALPGGMIIVWAIRLVATLAAVLGGLAGPFEKMGVGARKRFVLWRLRKVGISPERAASVGFLVDEMHPAQLDAPNATDSAST